MTRIAVTALLCGAMAAIAASCASEPGPERAMFELPLRPPPKPAPAEQAQEEQPTLTPLVADATLTIGGRIVKATSGTESWVFRRRFGLFDIEVREDAIVATDAIGTRVWETRLKEKVALLGGDPGILYVATIARAAQVRRINLNNGAWLDPLTLPVTERKVKTADAVLEVLPSPDGVLVLSACVIDDKTTHDDGEMLSYRVSLFAAGKVAPVWSQEFSSAGAQERPGAFLLSGGGPEQVGDFRTPLTLVGKTVVVCAGAQQDLVCLDRATGRVDWCLERLWEYQRGFTGPSVWAYHLGRYGIEDAELNLAEKGDEEFKRKVAKARERLAEHRGSIIAGPAVVTASDGAVSLFVVFAVSESARWSNYLADARVFEVTDRGKPVGVGNLPKMVRTEPHVDGDAAMWGCAGGGFLRVAPNGGRSSGGGMLGGRDMLCRIEWYREFASPRVEAWMTTAAAGDQAAFSTTYAWRPVGGGYVVKEGDRIYHFPIQRIDLKTGRAEALVLDVPCDKAIPRPHTNYTETAKGIEALTPHLLGVTWVQVVGDSLEIVLGMPEKAASIRFPLKELEK